MSDRIVEAAGMIETRFSPVLVLAVLTVVIVGIFLARLSRKSERFGTTLAVGGGVLFIVLVVGGAFMLWRYRAEKASERMRHATEQIAQHKRMQYLHAEAYQQAWHAQPKEGPFSAWVKEPELFIPQRGQSRIGGFSYSKQDDQGRLAGYSSFERDEDAAKAQAWQCAAARLRTLVSASCALKEPSRRRGAGPIDLEGIIREQIARRQPEIEIDSYHDRVALDYGTVHRAAVLVKAEPSLIEELAASSLKKLDEQYRAHLKRQKELRITWAKYLGGGVFLFLIILAIYLFLNAHTKGYYAWPLRFLAIALYAAAVAAFILLVGRFSSG